MTDRVSAVQGAWALPNALGARFENAQALRYAISVAAGLMTTLLLFLLMQALIKSNMNPFTEPAKGHLLEFVRLQEELVPPPHRPRPKRPEPPDEMPPDLPEPEFNTQITRGVEIRPVTAGPHERGLAGPGFRPDGEYLPIVKVAPVYPRRAQSRGIEGYVLLEFVVTATGAVRDPVVIESKPPGIFDHAAIQAALKFKYKPKVANGEPMDVSGVRNLIKFELTDK